MKDARQKSYTTASFLALFLGVFGIHDFYLERTWRAILHLIIALGLIISSVLLYNQWDELRSEPLPYIEGSYTINTHSVAWRQHEQKRTQIDGAQAFVRTASFFYIVFCIGESLFILLNKRYKIYTKSSSFAAKASMVIQSPLLGYAGYIIIEMLMKKHLWWLFMREDEYLRLNFGWGGFGVLVETIPIQIITILLVILNSYVAKRLKAVPDLRRFYVWARNYSIISLIVITLLINILFWL